MIESWRDNKLFSGLTVSELDIIEKIIETRSVEANEYILREGDPASEIYILNNGEAEVLKKEINKDRQHRIALIQDGEVIGDLALLDQGPRSASVRSLRHSELLIIPFENLSKVSEVGDQTSKEFKTTEITHTKLLANLAQILSKRLRISGDKALSDAQLRLAMGQFIIFILILSSIYTLIVASLPTLEGLFALESTSLLSIPIEFIFAGLCLLFIKQSGFPVSLFGITTNNWKESIIEGLIYTMPIVLVMFVIKFVLIYGEAGWTMQSLFTTLPLVDNTMLFKYVLYSVLYILFVPVQEFIVRGALQSSFQFFIFSPHKTVLAILLSNLAFGIAHLHISFELALLSFIAGLFWGWLYSRTNNLIGVSVSHIVIGLLVFNLFGNIVNN